MNPRIIAASLVRLFAIGLVIYSLSNASFAFYFFFEDSASFLQLYGLIAAVFVPLLIAVILWFFPQTVVGLGSVKTVDAVSNDFDAATIFRVGSALIGLYLIISSIAFILQWLITYLPQEGFMDENVRNPEAIYFSLIPEVFILFAGLLLFFGSSAVTRIFLALRDYGLEKPNSSGKS